MSNEMENFMEEIEKSMVRLHRGDIVTGRVINVTDDEITVNVGYKSDGIIPRNEISNDTSVNPHDVAQIGEEIKVYIIKVDDGDGNVLLSKKKVDAEKGWEDLEKIKESQSLVETKVIEAVRGGVIAICRGIRCFIPASQLSDKYVDDLRSFIGKSFNTKIIELDRRKNKVVLSRKVVLREEFKEKKNEVFSNLQKGDRIKGEVKQITDFGAFVDIGGIDGLVHISEISWGRVKHPSEVLKTGEAVEVEILDFDKEAGKISLSIKNTQPQPWKHIEENYKVGDVVEGKVVKMVEFGAFVELEPGLDGLVHISQISEKHIAKASDVLSINQSVKVKILDINKEEKRISLSITAAEENKEEIVNEYTSQEDHVTIGDVVDTLDASNENKES
ncbi:30S ribosomal protein S1 [Clostridium aceticum]|uniref:30S ribosomal protein S1 n=1 Tax=Clostridium aceticum TaxID=84022 RepID=A0A0D8IFC9_9CLOT|nr:30S ribosomal protein S1 [Clostridium aceticum]AKL95397.1 30S ribosomal protein S1 [Clostridium aceticum]KJF28799.1 30S ribosomal protein S1 [Clostridium aceticum]